ncbi:MAG: heme-copper oxidase subunit III [Planctomycetes bacterium]|nr:heme-copper oxidase subunit III [Planctomycetota bacterium]
MKDQPERPAQGISNETFGMILFLIAEVMFFAALVSTYIVLRNGVLVWRPANLPPLVSWISIANTATLCASAATMLLALRSVRRDDPDGLKLYLGSTLLLGCTFVAAQAYDLWRLLGFVTWRGNVFGSVFYALCGLLHGLHVLGGLAILACVTLRALRGRYHRYKATGVIAAGLYWHFVVAVWLFLFFALYVF